MVTPTVIQLPGVAGYLLATSDAMWVEFDGGLWRLDPVTNRVTRTVALDPGQEYIAFGFGSIWTTNFDAEMVLRIDPASGRVVARIPTPNPQGIIAAGDAIWVANHHEGTVTRIDPRTNKSSGTISVGPTGPGGPQRLALIGGKIWVEMFNASQVVAFDPATGKVATTVAGVAAPCGDMTASANELWISECGEQRSVDQVDLGAGTLARDTWVGGNVGTPIPVPNGVWLPLNSGRLLKMSNTTGQPVDAVALPAACALSHAGSALGVPTAAVAFGSVWIACGESLLRLKPSDLP